MKSGAGLLTRTESFLFTLPRIRAIRAAARAGRTVARASALAFLFLPYKGEYCGADKYQHCGGRYYRGRVFGDPCKHGALLSFIVS
jgi:hypothetical protein